MVEINCHGGLFVTNKIYELLVVNGARPANPGEFTKRAFLNGRIDLTKAEAVMDVISAENNAALSIASKGLLGFIKRTVRNRRFSRRFSYNGRKNTINLQIIVYFFL